MNPLRPQTYNAGIGVDTDDTTAIGDLTISTIGAGAPAVWEAGTNYVSQSVTVNASTDWVVIIVDNANSNFGQLNGFQIAQVTSGGGDTYTDWIGGFPGVGGQTALNDDPDGDGIDTITPVDDDFHEVVARFPQSQFPADRLFLRLSGSENQHDESKRQAPHAWSRNPLSNLKTTDHTDIPLATQPSDRWNLADMYQSYTGQKASTSGGLQRAERQELTPVP